MKLSLKLLAALVSASFCLQASAATITVINTNDSGAGSLRQAIIDSSSGDTINFDSSLNGQTITLTSGELLINKNLTITGPGANLLAINGNANARVFEISLNQTVTISDLTITNGSADLGGGIYNSFNATLTVTNCTVSGNSASALGGGIYNFGGATLTISNTTLSGNSANSGGGIENLANLTVSNSTISGNSATSFGGGIRNDGFDNFPILTVSNSTLSGNSASAGGGIEGDFISGDVTLIIGDSILNANTPQNIVTEGTVTSNGYNLSSDDASAYLNQPSDQNNTNPMLGPLQDNGGPTFTHELLSGSPAIDAGDPNFTPPPFFDQRGPGFPRVVNGRIDIGSFEVQSSASCVQGQGYWKNHPDQWPVPTLQLGTVTYTQEQLLLILHQPVRGNGLLILAHQEIAAELNIANGADGSCIQQTLVDADALIGDLVVPPVGTGYLRPGDVSALADTLDQYNEGMLCAPACSDRGPIPTPTPRARPALHPRPH